MMLQKTARSRVCRVSLFAMISFAVMLCCLHPERRYDESVKDSPCQGIDSTSNGSIPLPPFSSSYYSLNN